MSRWHLLFLSVLYFGCGKDQVPSTQVDLRLKPQGSGDFVLFENVNGIWDSNAKHAEINASGYNFELFHLNLGNLEDTGFVANLSTDKIYYFDGLEFYPSSITNGFIHISRLTPAKIEADFLINFISRSNNSNTITGTFEISNK